MGYAQAIKKDSLSLDSILIEFVVTAQRSPKPVFSTPEPIEILIKDRISGVLPRTSPEALEGLTGVFVQKTNHGGGSPFLRGLTGNQILLLIDGIRLNNATTRYGPNQYFNTVDLFSIEKIEVLRGSGAVQYGSDALGGAIQAFSPSLGFTDHKYWGGGVQLRVGTRNMEQTGHGRIQYNNIRFAVTGGFTWRNFGDVFGGDTTGRQSPSGYKEIDADFKMKTAISKKLNLTFLHQNIHQKEVPIFHKIRLENFEINQIDPQKRMLSYAKIEHDFSRNLLKSMSVTVSHQQNKEGRLSRKNGSTILRSELDQVQTFGVIAQVNVSNNKRWTSQNGFEAYQDRVHSQRSDNDLSTGITTPKRGLYPNDSKMMNMSIFSLHEFDWNKWQLNTGLRWNHCLIESINEVLGETRIAPSAFIGNISLLRKIGQGRSNIFATANTGFRTPNIDDLGTLGIVDFRYEVPNFNLKPEHSRQYQLGYKIQTPRFQGEVFLYQNRLRNLISRVKQDTQTISGYPVYQKINTDQARIEGIEASSQTVFTQNWILKGSLAYTYGHNITANEPLRRIPPFFGRLSVCYKRKAWLFSSEYAAAGKQGRLSKADTEDNRIPVGGTPGWWVTNFSISYSKPKWKIQMSALNLFDQDYRTHGSGINGYGRSVFANLSLQI